MRRQGLSLHVWGTELFKLLAALAILHQDDLKKRINRITATRRNVFFEKWLIILFTLRQKLFFKSSLLLNG